MRTLISQSRKPARQRKRVISCARKEKNKRENRIQKLHSRPSRTRSNAASAGVYTVFSEAQSINQTRVRRRSHPKHGTNNNPTATPSAVSRALVNYIRLRRRGLDPLVCMHRQEARHSRSPGEGNDGVLPARL